jgi:hypothetical protein
MRTRRGLVAAAGTAIAALALQAAPALATFHLIQIREVYPGSAAGPGSEYVELQMWEADQNHVGGHVLRTYDASGAVTGSASFLADVPRGATQSTMVLATPEAEAQFGFAADASIAPSGRLDPAGGAVCWESLDCVSWGAFSGALPSSAGPPAASGGIPDGMALRRLISPGCATLLEPADDRGNSALDFAAVFPAPRPNSAAPSERACGSGAGGAGESPYGPTGSAPRTVLEAKPPKRSRDRTPTFRFAADSPGASFECSLDAKPFRSCRSPMTAKPLSPGRHRFRVRARGEGGVDPTPALCRFRILPARQPTGPRLSGR